MIDPVERETRRALTEFASTRICSVGGEGTGNLIRHGGNLYVATCKHVADYYFKHKRPYIFNRENSRVISDNIEYAGCTDDRIDIALLKLVTDPGWQAYELNDLEPIEDFSTHSFDRTNLLIVGLPAGLSYSTDIGRYHRSLSYLTIPDSQAGSSDFLFAQYSPDRDLLTGDGLSIRLPPANGLSGAFILRVRPFTGDDASLWSPEEAKVVAIQVSWNKKTWIKGSSVTHLFSLLEQSRTT